MLRVSQSAAEIDLRIAHKQYCMQAVEQNYYWQML